MSEWISVEDKLPETGFLPIEECSLPVLVWYEGCEEAGDAIISNYCDWHGSNWVVDDGINHKCKVTHWAEMLAPPTDTKPQS